jgi:hypothetical protein
VQPVCPCSIRGFRSLPVFRMQQAAAAAVLVALLCAFYFNQPWAPDRPSDGVEAEFKEVSSDFQFTFNVDPVEVSSDPITRRNMSDPVDICHSSWTSRHSNLEACYVSSALPATRCIRSAPDGERDFDHGLISAFYVSFAQHKRLVLRPDDIFFPLVDAAATHVFKQGIYRTAHPNSQLLLSLEMFSNTVFCRRRCPPHLRELRGQENTHR